MEDPDTPIVVTVPTPKTPKPPTTVPPKHVPRVVRPKARNIAAASESSRPPVKAAPASVQPPQKRSRVAELLDSATLQEENQEVEQVQDDSAEDSGSYSHDDIELEEWQYAGPFDVRKWVNVLYFYDVDSAAHICVKSWMNL